MFDIRIDCCPACDGEGQIHCEEFWGYHPRTGDPEGVSWDEPCDLCDGTGGAFVQAWPVECSELGPLVPA